MAKILVVFFSICLLGCVESTIEGALKKYNRGTVQYISVDELAANSQFLILDTREKYEYDVSHLPGAQWVGYKSFSLDRMKTALSRMDTSIVVYCSVGVRSENIGEKFLDMGYTEVNNLYGGIFEWKNKGYIV
ncbi:MAG: rhodanese-like domain-containing protein, partial [Flavobacteriaceae bacterium]